ASGHGASSGSSTVAVFSAPPAGTRTSAGSSRVRPPRVRRRNLRTLVLDGNAAERIVLALRMPLPVVGHQDASQRRVAVVDDAEHVVCLALVPVRRRVDLHTGPKMR